MKTRWLKLMLLCSGLAGGTAELRGDETDPNATVTTLVPSVKATRTFGGLQFWSDVSYFRGWRIQENSLTQQCRLLDPANERCAAGSFDECRQTLEKIRTERRLAPETGRAVVLIHGLLQTSNCMSSLSTAVEEAGYTPVRFGYPSTQLSMPETARQLHRLMESLDNFAEIDFVAHSMGGLIVRAYLAEYSHPRIHRIVMLGTPNHGAELADYTQKFWILRTAGGPNVRELGTHPDGLIPQLPIPAFEFAVIAGSRGTEFGWNPFVPGDDDGTVAVASTRLPGAADFATVPVLHSQLLRDADVAEKTVHFLKEGTLRPGGDAQPISAAAKPHSSEPKSENGSDQSP